MPRKIEAKNGLENYCFSMRNTLNEEKLKEKFETVDKGRIESAVQETLDWLDKNQLAEKDEFEAGGFSFLASPSECQTRLGGSLRVLFGPFRNREAVLRPSRRNLRPS